MAVMMAPPICRSSAAGAYAMSRSMSCHGRANNLADFLAADIMTAMAMCAGSTGARAPLFRSETRRGSRLSWMPTAWRQGGTEEHAN